MSPLPPQKLQKKRVGQGERLVVTPSKSPSGLWNGSVVGPSTVTPKRVTQRTPKSATKKVTRLVRTVGQQDGGSMFSRRQLVRVVARSSRYASLEAQNHRRYEAVTLGGDVGTFSENITSRYVLGEVYWT